MGFLIAGLRDARHMRSIHGTPFERVSGFRGNRSVHSHRQPRQLIALSVTKGVPRQVATIDSKGEIQLIDSSAPLIASRQRVVLPPQQKPHSPDQRGAPSRSGREWAARS